MSGRFEFQMLIDPDLGPILNEYPKNAIDPYCTGLPPGDRRHLPHGIDYKQCRRGFGQNGRPEEDRRGVRFPKEGLARACNEQSQVPGDCQFEKNQGLQIRDVHMEIIFANEQHAEGLQNSYKPQDSGHRENTMHIPSHRFGIQPGVPRVPALAKRLCLSP
ncbi:protein of unknown function [Acidithiobacillus ferrivorans]|uniref:Uncharacterized protein n=1 Tax=Acidithiobacillus ferrivorans TaxID=160808 RepID=A0ABY1MS57_9PROT|nr:protein of unknown function [Acidithiobacillus ferrivorans]